MLSAIAARAGELLAAALIAAGVCVAAAATGVWWLKRRLRRRLDKTARALAARVAVTAAGAVRAGWSSRTLPAWVAGVAGAARRDGTGRPDPEARRRPLGVR
jgi:Flp pilus assembly protein TadB